MLLWTSFIGQIVHPVSGQGWDIGLDGGFRYLASFEHQFIRVNENLVQYPSNNISILPEDVKVCGKIVFKIYLRS